MSGYITSRTNQFAYFDRQLGQPDWASATVLDFGGNAGNILLDPRCTIEHRRYWCLDVGRDAIELGARRLPAGHFVHYDRYSYEYNPTGIAGLPIPDLGRGFDIILAYSVFTHADRTEMRRLVDRLRSMLAEGGRLAFTFLDPGFLPPPGWARHDQVPGSDNLLCWMTAAPGTNGMAAAAARAADRPLTWVTVIGRELLVLDPADDWVPQHPPGSSYITFCTERHMQSIFPEARILPPIRPERHSCCVLGRSRTAMVESPPAATTSRTQALTRVPKEQVPEEQGALNRVR